MRLQPPGDRLQATCDLTVTTHRSCSVSGLSTVVRCQPVTVIVDGRRETMIENPPSSSAASPRLPSSIFHLPSSVFRLLFSDLFPRLPSFSDSYDDILPCFFLDLVVVEIGLQRDTTRRPFHFQQNGSPRLLDPTCRTVSVCLSMPVSSCIEVRSQICNAPRSTYICQPFSTPICPGAACPNPNQTPPPPPTQTPPNPPIPPPNPTTNQPTNTRTALVVIEYKTSAARLKPLMQGALDSVSSFYCFWEKSAKLRQRLTTSAVQKCRPFRPWCNWALCGPCQHHRAFVAHELDWIRHFGPLLPACPVA